MNQWNICYFKPQKASVRSRYGLLVYTYISSTLIKITKDYTMMTYSMYTKFQLIQNQCIAPSTSLSKWHIWIQYASKHMDVSKTRRQFFHEYNVFHVYNNTCLEIKKKKNLEWLYSTFQKPTYYQVFKEFYL